MGGGNLSGIPASEREATQGWLNAVEKTDSIQKLNSLSRTVKDIFNKGEVSFASAKMVVDAAENKIAVNLVNTINSATSVQALEGFKGLAQTLRDDRIISAQHEETVQRIIRRRIAAVNNGA